MFMGKDTQANLVLGHIRQLAQSYKGHLLLVLKEFGYTGTGYISFPNLTEIIFDFSFISTGFSIEIRGVEQTVLQLDTFIDYSDQGEIEAIIELIETRIKVLDADE